VSTTVGVPIKPYDYLPVPINTYFYTFDGTGAVTGFAQRVIDAPALLNPYTTMDLSNRVVAGYDATAGSMFAASVFNT
jgi:hypothetical protein